MMQVRVDHGSGDQTVLLVTSGRKGSTSRALALQSALRGMGRDVPLYECLRVAREGGPIYLDDYAATPTPEKEG